MKRKKTNSAIFIYTAIALLFLTLLSMTLLPGLAAKFSSDASGSDAAHVARFDISASGSATASFTLDMAPNDPAVVKTLRVESDSEVTVRYTLTVHSTGNLPLRYSWDGGAAGDGDVATSVTVAPGAYQKDHTLAISWLSGDDSYHYEGELEKITVTVTAEQID